MEHKYNQNDYGFWKVNGEDPNCDLGGSHHEPFIGIFEGKYVDVYNYVSTLDKWATWGRGGTIEKIDIKTIDSKSTTERKELIERKESLQKELESIENKLK